MKTPRNNIHSAELELQTLDEKDALWQLLEESPPQEASPLFSRNILREIRLDEEAKPFWKKLLRPQFALPVTAAALIGIAFLPFLTSPEARSPATVSNPPVAEQPSTLVSYLDEELLLAAADEPTLFSDDEVIAMLF